MNIAYSKVSSPEEAFEKVRRIITPEYIAQFKVKAEVEERAEELTLIATGRGFTLKLMFLDEKTSIDLKLSFLLKGLKSRILKQIKDRVEDAL